MIFFVYGTLKQGHGNNRLLNHPDVKFLGEFVTKPEFTMISLGGFPAVLCEGDTPVHGELYETENESVIRRVYSLEGYSGTQHAKNNWYDVETIPTKYGDASMFVFRNADKYKNYERIENGIF